VLKTWDGEYLIRSGEAIGRETTSILQAEINVACQSISFRQSIRGVKKKTNETFISIMIFHVFLKLPIFFINNIEKILVKYMIDGYQPMNI